MLVEPLLIVRRVLREQFVIQHRRLLAIVRDDDVCRRLMTTPGVGPVADIRGAATFCSLLDKSGHEANISERVCEIGQPAITCNRCPATDG